jgi:poly-gamma-glutamate capsule biosynthesis protein CapA/YwtB (metallophosphatase superfamily)
VRKKYIVIGIFISVFSIFISSALLYYMYNNSSSSSITNHTIDYHAVTKKTMVPKEFRSSVTLAAVGDILIHGVVYNSAKTASGYDFSPMFSEVKPYLNQADITFANQETMVGGEGIGLSTYPRFNSPFNVADTLKETGVDIISIANNHTLDRGEKALLNATNYYNQIGLMYTGGYQSPEDRLSIRTIRKNGITFSFLAYTYGTNGIPIPKGKPYIVNLIDLRTMSKDINEAKKISDVVVVSLHYGNEYQRMPSIEQKNIVKEAVSYGADIILGHHPHVLQPMEWVTAENGNKGFVVYSLGNFLSGQKSIYREIGGILTLTVQKELKQGQVLIEIKGRSFLPTYVAKNGYKVVPLDDASKYGLSNSSKWLSDINSHMNQFLTKKSIAKVN